MKQKWRCGGVVWQDSLDCRFLGAYARWYCDYHIIRLFSKCLLRDFLLTPPGLPHNCKLGTPPNFRYVHPPLICHSHSWWSKFLPIAHQSPSRLTPFLGLLKCCDRRHSMLYTISKFVRFIWNVSYDNILILNLSIVCRRSLLLCAKWAKKTQRIQGTNFSSDSTEHVFLALVHNLVDWKRIYVRLPTLLIRIT